MPIPGDYSGKEQPDDNQAGRSTDSVAANITADYNKEADAHAPASFSKLMAEIGGAWRILVFMAFLATVLAFTYIVLLRFFSGPIIWVSTELIPRYTFFNPRDFLKFRVWLPC